MSYLDKVLQPGEQVVATGKKHWIIYLPGTAAIALAVIVGLSINAAPRLAIGLVVVTAVLGLFSVVLLLREWFQQWATEIVVTNRRVVYKTGFISRYTTEMNMEKIESVVVNQNLLGRILGYGTISVRGTGEGIENLNRIADPLRLRNAISVR
jgi:uncharacterized membrane protein YdbT with pleckstrin-like domain